MQKNAAQQQADDAARGQLIGDVAGAGSSLLAMSDERLKKNIKPLFTQNGVNFYSFEANEEGERMGMDMTQGVIAQEVERIYPDLVHEINGYKAVDYGKLLERVA